jgi:hypothetical protein
MNFSALRFWGLMILGIGLLGSCKDRRAESLNKSTEPLRAGLGYDWGAKKKDIVSSMLKREGVRADPSFQKTFITPEIHFRGGSYYGLRAASWSFAYSDSLGLYYVQLIFEGNEKLSEAFAGIDTAICREYGMTSTLTESTGRMRYQFSDGNEITLSIIKPVNRPPTISLDFSNQQLLDSAIALQEKLKVKSEK